jgi:Secretion system C-terminal sorting domain
MNHPLLLAIKAISSKNSSKTAFLMLFAIASCISTNAQTLSPTVISADGGRISTSEMTIDWTIGETFVDAYLVNSGMITEGFHQPILKVENDISAISAATDRTILGENANFSMNCWPNPVAETLSARINSDKWTTATIQLINEKGQTIEQSVQNTNIDFEISMRNYQNGHYFLQFLNPAGQLLGSKKITHVR